jgi:uncharacterized phage protein (TIGR02218 family)
MKEPSQDYIDKEEATTRKPVELYKIWTDTTYWYYTNGDVAVTYSGVEYVPTAISRDSTSYDSTMDVTTINVKFAVITNPVIQFVAQNPITTAWIEISRLFRDQDPLEKGVIFIGQIKTVSFKGTYGEASCVGFEHFLRSIIPLWRYSTTCNHTLFDVNCKKVKASYKVTATVLVDETQTIITSATFATMSDGYFARGLMEFEGEYRTMVSHVGDTVTLNYRMLNLEDNDTVSVSPGCDGIIETCRDKFDNILNFLGMPFIPVENPSLRIQ